MPNQRNYSTQRSQAARKIAAAQLPAPCTICRRIVTADMIWQADHVVPRALAEAQGWPVTEIDSASNIGPSHASCNARSGQAVGMKLRATAKVQPRVVPQIKRPSLGGSNV